MQSFVLYVQVGNLPSHSTFILAPSRFAVILTDFSCCFRLIIYSILSACIIIYIYINRSRIVSSMPQHCLQHITQSVEYLLYYTILEYYLQYYFLCNFIIPVCCIIFQLCLPTQAVWTPWKLAVNNFLLNCFFNIK